MLVPALIGLAVLVGLVLFTVLATALLGSQIDLDFPDEHGQETE